MKCASSWGNCNGGITMAKARASTPQSARLTYSRRLLLLVMAGERTRLIPGNVDSLGELGISNGVFPDGRRQFGVQFADFRKQEKDHHEEARQGQVDYQIRPPADAHQVGNARGDIRVHHHQRRATETEQDDQPVRGLGSQAREIEQYHGHQYRHQNWLSWNHLNSLERTRSNNTLMEFEI